MMKFILLAALVAMVASQTLDQKGSLDDLLGDVFTKEPPVEQAILNQGNQKPVNVAPVNQPSNTNSDGDSDAPTKCETNGECVPYYLCVDGKINTDGSDLLDIRLGEDESPCVDYFEQCCNADNVLEKPVEPVVPVEIKSGCGFRNAEGVGFRITGNNDNEAEYAEFPWMVAVLKEEQAGDQVLNVYQCGGSLIHPSVVLTAAHCVIGKSPQALKIRAGEWDTQTKNELYAHEDREVADFVTHKEYYKAGLFNDMALLFLRQPVQIAEHINVACLPPQGQNFNNARCFASGWGKDVFGKEGKYQVILKKIELPVVPNDVCQNSLRTTRLGKRFNLHQSFMCAGGEPGKDTCKGDGGSPLVCPIPGAPGRFYQAGIVAWGIGCGENGTPGVYANVGLFRSWVDAQMKLKNLDTHSYSF